MHIPGKPFNGIRSLKAKTQQWTILIVFFLTFLKQQNCIFEIRESREIISRFLGLLRLLWVLQCNGLGFENNEKTERSEELLHYCM